MKKIILLLGLLLGCQFLFAQSEAEIYLIHKAHFQGAAVPCKVDMDEQYVGETTSGQYMVVTHPQGTVNLKTYAKQKTVDPVFFDFEIDGDGPYYILIDVKAGFVGAEYRMSLVGYDEVENFIAKYKRKM